MASKRFYTEAHRALSHVRAISPAHGRPPVPGHLNFGAPRRSEGTSSMDTDCTLDSCPAYGLGRKALIVYLSFLSAFTPLSTDLFLPALPIMADYFQSSPGVTNLTLMGFMFCFALSMLVWGPLSDKYGRRPIILAGLALYLVSSVLCALSTNIWMLIAGRVAQAVGSGAVSAVAMAIAKDVFKGRTMENVLTAIQTMMLLAPMIAPVLGGFLLALTSWRGIFWAFVVCGVVAWLGLLPLRESLERPTEGPALKSLGRIAFVLGNARFSALLVVFSVAGMPIMVYLATSAYVYQQSFGVSPQLYSGFFCANALASVLGPTLYPRVLRKLPQNGLITACFAVIAAGAALLLLFGHAGPFWFAALMLPVTFCSTAIRPPSTIILMTQIDSDTGAVASLIGSAAVLCGSLSMLASGLWSDPLVATAVISLFAGLFCLAGWIILGRRERSITRG